ncbi:hypothetical protein HJC10_23935 [Corallococcus exiguus]|uniref:hypothetical protein n=1 Tax=Corallococcus TaxID=83461 RepID=UPI000EE68057|nr:MULTISPECIES: hypothetical protein [Corallococcus]NNB86544.1 hypothetical protein [Corallococcus exiguus]NNB92737.1 hypothetical protein [Corallococcus exiguus]NNC05896.1 hypothetical protein [Corallococcus exiguus]NPC49602.1 hypothetical protein [Corallococcus exiguus]NRD53394.1 hypothetical protein [Corallococcus exiguus]
MTSRRYVLVAWMGLLALHPGCATTLGDVRLRADGTPMSEKCPEKSLEVMRYLQLYVGEAAWVQLDANQSRAEHITLHDGPIESVLDEDIGTLEAPMRLYGQVWTGGEQPVIRYYEAQFLKGKDRVPICAVARLGFGQLRKRPESKPGTAILNSPRAGVYIVDEFR